MQQHKVQKNADTENICIGVCILSGGGAGGRRGTKKEVGIKTPGKCCFKIYTIST